MTISGTLVLSGPQVFPVAYAEAKGRRSSMEDALVIIGDFAGPGTAYYAVFDGHGGSEVSRHAAYNLHGRLSAIFSPQTSPEQVIRAGFADLDSAVSSEYPTQGSTAAIAIISKDTIHTANVGDTRVVLVEPNGTVRQLTQDHRASDPSERALILERGGTVVKGRAGGVLALSRSLGDGELKKHISAEPFILNVPRQDGQILIIACDGVWDVMDGGEVASLARRGRTPSAAAKAIKDAAIALGTTDNVSVIVAFLTAK
jgi:serine/threonine protein phosphatase PrpC